METNSPDYSPQLYDDARLDEFYNRAVHYTNLLKEYIPDKNVNKAAFADAMVGFYLDAGEERYIKATKERNADRAQIVYKSVYLEIDDPVTLIAIQGVLDNIEEKSADDTKERGIGRVRADFSIDFLKGTGSIGLKIIFDSLGKKEDNVKSPREYALGVAGGGARHFRDKNTVVDRSEKTEGVSLEVEPSYEDFIDLEDYIKRLHEEELLLSGEAAAMLILFRQVKLTKSLGRDHIKSIMAIRDQLQGRLRHTAIMQPHKGEHLADRVFVRGAGYLKSVLENPVTMLESSQTLDQLTQMELIRDDSLNPKTAYDSVLGHIGYVLDKMYQPPRKS